MLLAGDEFGHTQKGNNNAYCQDNEITWLDWTGQRDEDKDLTRFTRRLIALRNAVPDPAAQPLLRRRAQPRARREGRRPGSIRAGRRRRRRAGTIPASAASAWCSTAARSRPASCGRARTRRCSSSSTRITTSSSSRCRRCRGGNQWKCLIDTNIPERPDEPRFAPGEQYQVTGRSLLLFVLENGLTPAPRLQRTGCGTLRPHRQRSTRRRPHAAC